MSARVSAFVLMMALTIYMMCISAAQRFENIRLQKKFDRLEQRCEKMAP